MKKKKEQDTIISIQNKFNFGTLRIREKYCFVHLNLHVVIWTVAGGEPRALQV